MVLHKLNVVLNLNLHPLPVGPQMCRPDARERGGLDRNRFIFGQSHAL